VSEDIEVLDSSRSPMIKSGGSHVFRRPAAG
jgi:hypothetical protein